MSTLAVPDGSPPAPSATSWRVVAALVRYCGLAPILYLLMALPTVVFLTVLTPPFQTPDETNHFRRAVQILRGEIVGHEITAPGWSGAHLPKSVVKVAESFSYLIGHPESRFSSDVMHDDSATPWDWSDREFTSFANTVIYPPFFYLPSVGALAAARQLGWNVLDAYRLARLVTGLSAVLIATLAIAMAARGRAMLFVILSLATPLYLFASISQDGLLIACMALAMGCCSRADGQKRPLHGWERVAVAMLLGAAVAARPPYVFALAVLVTPLVRCRPGGGWTRSRLQPLLPLLAALAIGLGWVVFGARPAQTPMRLEAGVSIAGQIGSMLSHPAAFPLALANTLRGSLGVQIEQAIAVLGWSETMFPPLYYLAATIALVLAAALALTGPRGLLSFRWGLLLAGAFALASASLYAALYLSWTTVGADYVDGFQGRYFLPAFMLLAVTLPALSGLGLSVAPAIERLGMRWRPVAWVALGLFAAMSDLYLPYRVFQRYYG